MARLERMQPVYFLFTINSFVRFSSPWSWIAHLYCCLMNVTQLLLCKEPHGERGLMPFLLSLVPKVLQNRVKMFSIQQVVQVIKSTGRYEWIHEFESKYGLSASI
jgi:hypothetical protein